MIQDVFLESDWDEVDQALAARDRRVAELQAEGFICDCTTLFRVSDGCRVFLVKAERPEPSEVVPQLSQRSTTSRSKPGRRERPVVEYR